MRGEGGDGDERGGLVATALSSGQVRDVGGLGVKWGGEKLLSWAPPGRLAHTCVCGLQGRPHKLVFLSSSSYSSLEDSEEEE